MSGVSLLLEVKRTSGEGVSMSAFEPKRTSPNSSLTTSRLLIHPGVEVATSQYINLH
jgi:hypothetical protein